MQRKYEMIRDHGVDVIAITLSPPPFIASYLKTTPVEFPLWSDREKVAYRDLALSRTSVVGFLNPLTLAGYVSRMATGSLPRTPAAGDDLMQLGGTILLDSEHRIRFVHRSTTPVDEPKLEDVLTHVVSK